MRPVVLLLGPHRDAPSGVSTHLNLLFASRLAEEFSLAHFQVGSEGRDESGPARLLRILTSPLLLAAEVLRRGAALVHLNTALNARAFWRDFAYMAVARICGARVLWQVHGGALPQEFFAGHRLLNALLRWALQLADVIVVLASVERDAYRRFVPRQRVLALPNGVDCAHYEGRTRTPTDPVAPLRLLYVGRLAREKGLSETLIGFKRAGARGANARLVIAGSGPEEAGLRRLAGELGIAAEVTFVGTVFGEGKLELLGSADAFVLASYAEGLPYALLECMAAGVPGIVTRVGAIPDVVIEGIHGLFVPARDSDAIADAIARLASDRVLLAQMGMACRKRIAGGYSIDRLAGDFRELYAELCGAQRIAAMGKP